jgi:hypothetical protein
MNEQNHPLWSDTAEDKRLAYLRYWSGQFNLPEALVAGSSL